MDPIARTLPEVSDIGGLIAEKVAETKAAGLEKRATQAGVDPKVQLRREFLKDAQTKTDGELVGTYGAQLLGEYKQQQAAQQAQVDTANRGRTTGELGKDAGLSLAKGAVGLVAGIPLALGDLATQDAVGAITGVADPNNAAIREHVILPGQKLLGEFNNWVNKTSSPVKQADQALMGQENAAVAAANQADYARAVKAGDNKALAILEREGAGLVQGATNVFNHPTVAIDTAIEQFPTLGMGALAKRAVSTAEVAGDVTRKLLAGGADDAIKAVGEKAVVAGMEKQVAEELAKRNLRGMVTASESGSNYGQAAGEITTMPWDDLVKHYPDAQLRKDGGESEDSIRLRLASKVGLTTAALTAPVAWVSAPLSNAITLSPFGKAGVKGAVQNLVQHPLAIAGEGLEETAQGAGGKIAQNIGQMLAGDITVKDALEGSGEAGGQGLAAAIGFSGALRAPGLVAGAAIEGTKLAGKATLGAVDAVLGALGTSATKTEESLSESVNAQKAAVAAGRVADADTLSKGFQAQQAPSMDGTPAPENPAAAAATAPVESSPFLTPADVAPLKGADPAEALDTVAALSRAINVLTVVNGEDGARDEAHQANLLLFAAHQARKLSTQLESITDPEMKAAATRMLENERVLAFDQAIKDIPAEAIQAKFDTLPEDTIPAGTELTPEVAQALAQIAELAVQAPEKLGTEQIKRAQFHSERMSPEESGQLELALQLATVREGFQANAEKTAQQFPQIKSATTVADNIFNRGFELNGKALPSLSDMAGNVVRALGNGHTQLATQAMNQMQAFVQGRIDRAQAFDTAARQHVENGSVKGQGVEVANSKTLATETSLGKIAAKVDVTSPGSQGLVDLIHNEAQAAAGIFNTLAAAHPQLSQKELTAPKEASWKSMTKGDGVAVPGSAPASAPAVAVPVAQPASKGVSSVVKALQPKVAAVLDYALNPPKDVTTAKQLQHIATMKSVEKLAATALKTTHPEEELDQHNALTEMLSTARAAREVLEASIAADAVAEPQAAPVADRREDNGQRQQATDRREQTGQRAQIDQLSPVEAELAKVKARNAELEQEQRTSSVTGLPNQKAFTEDVSLGWATVGAADMDGLKKLNDAVGHEAADTVLKALGSYLIGLQSDTVRFYHRSGDEFAARFKDAAEAATVMATVQDALDKIQVSFEVDGKHYTYNGIGFSVGHGATYEAADTAVNVDKAARLASGQRENPRDAGAPRRLFLTAANGEGDERGDQRGADLSEASDPVGSVAERFPGLAATLGEVTADTPKAEALSRSNKFLSSFKLAVKAQGLFTRFDDPAAELKAAFAAGAKGLRELYVETLHYLRPSESQRDTMEALLTKVAPAIAEQMDTHLKLTGEGKNADGTLRINTRTKKPAKGFLERMVAGEPVWSFDDKLSLHMTVSGVENGKPFVRFQPRIAQAVSLAAVHWAMNMQNAPVDYNEERVEKLFPNMSKELRDAFKTMHYRDAVVQALASDIEQVLGVRPDGDASQSYTKGLPLALAQQAMIAMKQLGFLGVVPVETGTDQNTATFISMNKASAADNARKDTLGLQAFRDALEQPALITRLLMPDSKTLPFIGTAPTVVDGRMSRTGQSLAKAQLTSMEKLGNVPYRVNTPFLEDMKALGRDAYLRLRGYDSRPIENLNVGHAKAVAGKNLSLTMAWDGVAEQAGHIGQYADEHADADGTPLQDVQVFYPVHMGSNTRTFMDATLNPQGSKDAREVFVATKATYDFAGNPKHKALWFSAIGQALDLGKVEQIATAEELAGIVEERLAKQDFTELFKAWQAMQAAEPESEQHTDQVLQVEALLGEIYAGKAVSAHALHAISDYARYQASEDKSDFTSALPIEIDGKTDGPFHALWHLGLHAFGKKLLLQLRQGGALFNTKERSLNEMGTSQGDMYINVGSLAKTLIQEKKEAADTPFKKQLMQASIELMWMIEHVSLKVENGEQVVDKVTRAPGKLTSTPMVYGSSANSAHKTLASTIIDEVYSRISEAMQVNPGEEPKEIPQRLQEHLRLLMSKYKKADGTWADTPSFNLRDPAKYKSFRFGPLHRQALADNLKSQAGGALTDSVSAELDPVLDTFGLLYKASAFQMFQYKTEFNAARDALREQRVAEGVLGPNDALSRNDEQALLKKLNAKAPIYQLIHSAGLSKDFGISIARPETGGRHLINGEEQRVEPLGDGYLGMHIPAVSLKEAGVRIAALLVQGLGDASMITELGSNDPTGMLPVFDGLGVSPLEMEKWGKEANQAVLKSMRFNGLKTVTDSFANSDMDFSKLSVEQMVELAEALHENIEELLGSKTDGVAENPADFLPPFLTRTRESTRDTLNHREKKIEFTKQALLDEGISQASIDHMAGAGAEGAVHIDGPLMEDPAFIARIQSRVEEQMAKALSDYVIPVTKPTESPKNVSEVLANLSQEGIKTLDSTDVQLLIESQGLQGKVRQFVFKQITHLLPANLQVHVGTHAEIAAKQQELFEGTDFGGVNEVGASLENHIFIKNNSEETLVHELVHAAVTHLLERYYTHGGKGLNKTQREAIAGLEKLTSMLVGAKKVVGAPTAFRRAQAVVKQALDEGNKAGAVNEFLAWTLSNQQIQDYVGNARVSHVEGLPKLGKTVLDLVRRALGLPKNVAVDSFLAQAMGEFRQLTRRPMINDGLTPVGAVLFQSLPGSNDDRLAALNNQLEWVLTNFPKDGRESDTLVAETHNARIDGEGIREKFEDAGFRFTDAQRHVFQQLQAVMASTIQVDSASMEGFQRLYNEVMPQLSAKDFLTNPNDTSTPAWSEAEARFNALQGVGNLPTDMKKRSNLLANFVALGLVDESFREKLATLQPAKGAIDKTHGVDQRFRSMATAVFNHVTDLAVGTVKAGNSQVVLDRLAQRLYQNQQATIKRQSAPPNKVDMAEQWLKGKTAAAGQKADAKRAARSAAGKVGGVDGLINGLLMSVSAMSSKDSSTAVGETLISALNQFGEPNAATKLGVEVIGRTESNGPLLDLLDQGKSMVSQLRQRLREEAPAQVRKLFKTPLDKKTWSTLHRVFGKADAKVLLHYSRAQVQGFYSSPAKLQSAIAAIEGQFTQHAAAYTQAAKELAHYMMTGDNVAKGLLYSNAHAMARLADSSTKVDAAYAEQMTPLLDRLVSLRTMEALSEAERKVAADLFTSDPEGVESLLFLLRTLTSNELGKEKAAEQAFNIPKGYVPASLDPRSQLILAGTDKAAELVKRGYRKIQDYHGDAEDSYTGDLAYYAVAHIGGHATYQQGAIQTVEGTVAGLDQLTGRSQGVALQTAITHPTLVARITAAKRTGKSTGDRNLVPVFDKDGVAVAYQRTLDPAVIDAHLRGSKDLPQAIGIWLGRQAEEAHAQGMNKQVVGVLRAQWEAEKGKQGNEYIDITSRKSPVAVDSWNSIPRETQKLLREAFFDPSTIDENERGKDSHLRHVPVWVRAAMLDNVTGYRAASVADVFTGMSDLPQNVQKAISNAAYGLMGKNAYRNLVMAERAAQSVVGWAKETIVVRSLKVAMLNLTSNQFQLVMHGINPLRLVPLQLAKARELEIYMRQAKRQAQVTLALASAVRPDDRSTLKRELQALQDANSRLSIWPLIQAGGLPSIAEGLSEHDEYTLLHDFSAWVSEKTKNIPPGLLTAAKYAVIAKDTALYQGLNRGIQFGDFMAKAVLYDHVITKGMSQAEALAHVSDRFVNYNLMAGRTRDYLENMGVTWFWNYKIRIQKIILATIRDNPLRFLMAGTVGGTVAGADTLMSENALGINWNYSIGPGQLFRAPGMTMWNQLVD